MDESREDVGTPLPSRSEFTWGADSIELERCVAEFEDAWRGNRKPSIDEYLPKNGPSRHRVLVELAHTDMEYRWKSGTETSAEEYFRRFPELAADRVASLELIRAEFEMRRRSFLTRFPDCAAELGDSGPRHDTARGLAAETVDAVASGVRGPAGTIDYSPVETYSVGPIASRGSQESIPKSLPNHEILGELGRGGMGVVYRARHTALGREVALKMMVAGVHASDEQLVRFRTEAQAVASLQHPHIVQIYEIGEFEGIPYFSLELVPGGSLSGKIAGKPQPSRDSAEMVEILARAIFYAHGQGVVHRDLKPSNVLLTQSGVPKISDFGLAKRLETDSQQTRSGSIVGSPSYMAPEQARGDVKSVGPRTDVYALGATLYELLTGRPPFLAAAVMETVGQVIRDEPVPPSRLRPGLARDLETICLKCLQKEPNKRYETAEALAEDLRRYLAGEPITARPVSAPERMWRWARRNPGIASLASGIVVIVSASFVLVESQRRAAVTAQKTAEVNERVAKAAKNQAEISALEAKKNFETAQEQADLATDSLQIMTDGLREHIEDTAASQQFRQMVLPMALERWQRVLVEGSQEREGRSERNMASAHLQLANIYLDLGQVEPAKTHYEQCLSICEKLAADDPQSEKAQGNLAAALSKLGDYYLARGDVTAATDFHRRAFAINQSIYARSELVELSRVGTARSLANSYSKLGQIALRNGELEVVEENFRSALELREQIVALDESSIELKLDLAGTLTLVGELYMRRGETAAANESYLRSIELREEVLKVKRESVRTRRDLARTYDAVGDTLLIGGDATAASKMYRRSLELCRELYFADPRRPDYNRQLSQTYYRVATAALHAGDRPASDENYRESLKLREALAKANPKNISLQIEYMIVLARCGQHVEAAAIAEEIRQSAPNDAGRLFQIACCYSLCAAAVSSSESPVPDAAVLGQRYADLAITALDQSLQLGLRNRASLKSDPDLEPIRNLPAFAGLLRRIGE